MDVSPEVESGSRKVVVNSTAVVVNIIWWMVMIAGIGLGATHLRNCPVEPYIPIYLIVLAAANLISLTVSYIKSILEDGPQAILVLSCAGLLHLFTFCWFIAGSVWVYSVYPPSYTSGGIPSRYCHKTTYLFTFVITTIIWVMLALSFFCGCCFALLACCNAVSAGRRLIPNRFSSFYGATGDFAEPTAGDV